MIFFLDMILIVVLFSYGYDFCFEVLHFYHDFGIEFEFRNFKQPAAAAAPLHQVLEHSKNAFLRGVLA